ncbi:MAG: hypothetical protein RLZZ04_507 [Cyanobacteriota bacterium]|jgi:hypothetical protein
MSEIKIQDLSTNNISGTNLFDDSENFMVELSEDNEQILGGVDRRCCRKNSYIEIICPSWEDIN